mmetsp:Transcript_16444/g.49498  ORF Transcript_16444/g.49498 Transcript_16444/m.49498 type:complete len:553 (-) Transcript_16444:1160-2818(-)
MLKGYDSAPASWRALSSAKAQANRRRSSAGLEGASASSNASSDATSGLSTTIAANASPQSRNNALPWNGNPGRFARTTRRKSGCTGTTREPSVGDRESTRPSGKPNAPSATSAFNKTVTSVGALSASSNTQTRPWIAARTNGASTCRKTPPSSVGVAVSDATVESRWSCAYSRSAPQSSRNRSTATFLPTPWFPSTSTAASPAASNETSFATADSAAGVATYSATTGTSSGAAPGARTGTSTRRVPQIAATAPRSTVTVQSPSAFPDVATSPHHSSTRSARRFGRNGAMSASRTKGAKSASPAARRRAIRVTARPLKRVAASPADRDWSATRATIEARFSERPGTSAASAAFVSALSHSGAARDEKHAATSPSSQAPGSAAMIRRKPGAASSRVPSGRSTTPSWSARPSAAANAPRGKRCAPSRIAASPDRIAATTGASFHTDAPVAASVSLRCSRSRAVRSRWQAWDAASGARRRASADLPPPAGPTKATCSPFSKSARAPSRTPFCVAESQRSPSNPPGARSPSNFGKIASAAATASAAGPPSNRQYLPA